MADLSGASLAELQRWFQAAVMSPGMSAAAPADASTVITASTRQYPAERLAVYRRGYRLRLLECLRASFPALCHLLGRDLFDASADDYLDACPSRSYTLFRVGEHFAEHLEGTRPDRDQPAAEREAWVDLMVDLARFERVFAEVYHGPGTETGPLLGTEELPADTDPAWPKLTLRPAPCLRLVTIRYAVHGYAAEIARGATPELPRPQPAVLAVHRLAYTVVITELTSTQAPDYNETAVHRRLLTEYALAPAAHLGAARLDTPPGSCGRSTFLAVAAPRTAVLHGEIEDIAHDGGWVV